MILVLPNVTMKLLNVRKKIKVQLNVAKVQSYMMSVLLNVTLEPLNVKKIELSNVTKVWSHVILVLHNVTIKLLNMRKKNKVP